MKIKSYFAQTIAEAINQARKEMGPEAVIVASRKNDGPSAHLGPYEVVCGIFEDAPAQPAPKAAPPAAEAKVPEPERRTPLKETWTNVRQQVDGLRTSGRRKPSAPDSNLIAMRVSLNGAGFGDYTDEILAGVKQRLRGQAKNGRRDEPEDVAEEAAKALSSELHARLAVNNEIGRSRGTRKVVAVVGPPGCGKTSSLVKLAVTHGLAANRGLHIVTMDSYRLGGSDQLRTYASAMSVGFDALEGAGSLSQCLERHRQTDLVMIDTPGLGPADAPGAHQLAAFLSRHPDIDVHLVLPSYMGHADLDAALTRFKAFLPSKLLFTHFDAAGSSGALLALAIRNEKPISFLGTGQQVPEDLAPATPDTLIGRFVRSAMRKSAVSAA